MSAWKRGFNLLKGAIVHGKKTATTNENLNARREKLERELSQSSLKKEEVSTDSAPIENIETEKTASTSKEKITPKKRTI